MSTPGSDNPFLLDSHMARHCSAILITTYRTILIKSQNAAPFANSAGENPEITPHASIKNPATRCRTALLMNNNKVPIPKYPKRVVNNKVLRASGCSSNFFTASFNVSFIVMPEPPYYCIFDILGRFVAHLPSCFFLTFRLANGQNAFFDD